MQFNTILSTKHDKNLSVQGSLKKHVCVYLSVHAKKAFENLYIMGRAWLN